MSNYKYGDIRDDGYVFNCYIRQPNGSVYEQWYSPKAKFRRRMNMLYNNCKRRADEKNVEIDIDTDYLLSIYPQDNLCPVLGIELSFGGDGNRGPSENSPSLDRIIPALGYTKGNVIFVSNKVNTIKSSATPEEIIRVGEFYQDLQNSE